MNRKQHLNNTLCRHIMRPGIYCLVLGDQVYMVKRFLTDSGFKGHQIIKIHNLAHAYRLMGY